MRLIQFSEANRFSIFFNSGLKISLAPRPRSLSALYAFPRGWCPWPEQWDPGYSAYANAHRRNKFSWHAPIKPKFNIL